MENVAVILAAGTGSRMGLGYPKQFALLPDGRTVLEHSVRVFASVPSSHRLIVVSHPDWMDKTREVLSSARLRAEVIAGGERRCDSSVNALRLVSDDDNVLIHDAARPFVSCSIIERCLSALSTHQACAVGVTSTDTVWQVLDGHIVGIPPRSTMFRAQTPQCFRASVIKQAYRLALDDPQFQATDDCGVLLAYVPSVKIRVIEGDVENKKVTFKSDL